MINITKIWCGRSGSGDNLRYRKGVHSRPVVVWNTTQRCNLRCIHCYARADSKIYSDELTTEQGKDLVNDLAEFGVPVLLFSGGEPLMRRGIFELAGLAKDLGLRTVLSTNGTLITEENAERLKNTGFSYIGISLDGMEKTNDYFRAQKGAYDAAVQGIRNCISSGLRTGLRFTLTKHNLADAYEIFDLIEKEQIPRVCFYHLVYSGRAADLMLEDLSHDETRIFIDSMIKRVEDLNQNGRDVEVLTVDNHSDAPYIYQKLLEQDSKRAQEALELFKMNGGNSSGSGIGCVDFNGYVHADQFWHHYSLGNVLKRRFSEIWTDETEPLLKGLRNRKKLLKGRCAGCRYLDICNGNFRVRAEAAHHDIWAPDPACYLTDKEIGIE
ncbi:MAG: radical SAM protein, partial [Nitrososphaerales archaeon]